MLVVPIFHSTNSIMALKLLTWKYQCYLMFFQFCKEMRKKVIGFSPLHLKVSLWPLFKRIYGFSYFCIYPPTYKPIYHTRPKFTSCKHQSKWLPYTFFGSCMDLTMGIFATQADFLNLAIFCASIVQSWQIKGKILE